MATVTREDFHNLSPLAFDLLLNHYRTTTVADKRAESARTITGRLMQERAQNEIGELRKLCEGTLRVLGGPFSGQHYGDMWLGGLLGPKILGSYEAGLHGWVDQIIAKTYATIINVGCAEGYYAVGLARTLPNSKVFAFDLDKSAQAGCAQLAKLNGVSGQVVINGMCSHQGLQDLITVSSLVVCDIEGGEFELLNPIRAPKLKYADILIELHDSLRPGLTEVLISRFLSTHIVSILGDGDNARRLYYRNSLTSLITENQFERFSTENRCPDQRWMLLSVKGRS